MPIKKFTLPKWYVMLFLIINRLITSVYKIVTMISMSVKMYLGVALIRKFAKGYKRMLLVLRFVGLTMVY